jgi:hypothetical protein
MAYVRTVKTASGAIAGADRVVDAARFPPD